MAVAHVASKGSHDPFRARALSLKKKKRGAGGARDQPPESRRRMNARTAKPTLRACDVTSLPEATRPSSLALALHARSGLPTCMHTGAPLNQSREKRRNVHSLACLTSRLPNNSS